ncbi:MAG: ATP-binding protein [Bacillota bacterium]|nr:ATP-binding protein [Bacillota bacterium]
MKKKNVLNLIKYYSEKNDTAFRNEAYEIAKYFDEINNYQLSEYIMGLLSSTNTFSPQIDEAKSHYFKKVETSSESLPLPEEIKEDVLGIVNAVGHNVGVNKFMFQGPPGTGKTESVKQIARILDRELFIVDFNQLIDSKLGQTGKNIAELFDEIQDVPNPEKVVVLFDEIDILAVDRINSNDLREMGRATSSVLKGLDSINNKVVIIATTNLFNAFDKALIRRFDSVVDYGRYSNEDLVEIAEIILNEFLPKFKSVGRNMRLFKKIIGNMESIPYPGDLKNMIKTSLAFSNPNSEFDYLKRLCKSALGEVTSNIIELHDKGFTLRELEILTGISKSQISRDIKEISDNE